MNDDRLILNRLLTTVEAIERKNPNLLLDGDKLVGGVIDRIDEQSGFISRKPTRIWRLVMVFKNKDLNSLDAILLSKGERQKPKNIYIEHGILPNSSVTLYENTGHYEPYERVVDILFKNPIQEPLANEWLDGVGELSFDVKRDITRQGC